MPTQLHRYTVNRGKLDESDPDPAQLIARSEHWFVRPVVTRR